MMDLKFDGFDGFDSSDVMEMTSVSDRDETLEESLRSIAVAVGNRFTLAYNSYYNKNMSGSKISEYYSDDMEKLKKYITSCKLDRKNNANLYDLLRVMKSGEYREAMIRETGSTEPSAWKEMSRSIYQTRDYRHTLSEMYLSEDGKLEVRTTNNSYRYWTGVQYLDLDTPKVVNGESVSSSDRCEIAEDLKHIITESSYAAEYWYITSLLSTSKTGVHIYTYVEVPSNYTVSDRIWYYQNNYRYIASKLYDVLKGHYDKYGIEYCTYLDKSLVRSSQTLNVSAADSDFIINPRFKRVLSPVKYESDNRIEYVDDNVELIGFSSIAAESSKTVSSSKPSGSLVRLSNSGNRYYFGHDTRHDDVPTLKELIRFLLTHFSFDEAKELCKGIYESPNYKGAAADRYLQGYLTRVYNTHKGNIYPVGKYVTNWCMSNLGLVSVPFEYDKMIMLESGEYMSQYFEEEIEDFLNSEDKILKIVAAPGTGKTEAIKKYMKNHLCDVLEPFNSIIANKYDGFYAVTSANKNSYSSEVSCVMIPDQYVRCSPDKSLLFIDEIHEIWNNSTFRRNCADALLLAKRLCSKIILMTGTPQDEDTLLNADRTIYYHKELPKIPLRVVTSKDVVQTLEHLVSCSIESGFKVGIYANRNYRNIENVLRIHDYDITYMHKTYETSADYKSLMSSHLLGEKQGILYTKVLSCGADINDECLLDMYILVDADITGPEIIQAMERFRNAKKRLTLIFTNKAPSALAAINITELLVGVANTSKTLGKLLAKYMVSNNLAVDISDGQYVVNEDINNILSAIDEYNTANSSKRNIIDYLLITKCVLMQDVVDNRDKAKKLKNVNRIKDSTLIKSHIEEVKDIYTIYKNSDVKFSDVFIYTDGEPTIEDNKVYVKDTAYVNSILKKIKYLEDSSVVNVNDVIIAMNDEISLAELNDAAMFIRLHKWFNNNQKEYKRLIKYVNSKDFVEKVIKILYAKYLRTIDSKKEEEIVVKKLVSMFSNTIKKFKVLLEWDAESILDNDPIAAFLQYDVITEDKIKIQRKTAACKPLINVKTGENYESREDAATKLSVSQSTITRYIKQGKLKHQ